MTQNIRGTFIVLSIPIVIALLFLIESVRLNTPIRSSYTYTIQTNNPSATWTNIVNSLRHLYDSGKTILYNNKGEKWSYVSESTLTFKQTNSHTLQIRLSLTYESSMFIDTNRPLIYYFSLWPNISTIDETIQQSQKQQKNNRRTQSESHSVMPVKISRAAQSSQATCD